MARKICGECKFYLVKGVCPEAYRSDSKLNAIARLSTDKACELFQPKFTKRITNELEMKEALELLNKHHYKCPTDTKQVLIYNDGIYEKAKSLIWTILESEYEDKLKRHFVDEAYAHLQRANPLNRDEINQYTNKIPIKNGLFNLLTREAEPFNPEQVYTFKLNVAYDPEAKCPNWLEFVKQVVADEDIPLLQEIMGYCLLPAMPYHKIFWLYGTGRNGKDRVIITLQEILGKETFSTLSISEFSENRRFSQCQLYGKLMNVSNEPKLSKYGLDTNVLKKLSGEGWINAELKGINQRLGFLNVAKFLVLGNHFPKVQDNSTGWKERTVVLNFPNSFEGEKGIPHIERRWIPKELNGIFNWMLNGLYRLNENNGFSISKSSEEMTIEFMKASNPFNAWILEECEKISSAYLTREEALTAYLEYCDEVGADRDSKRTFYEKMRKEPQVKDVKKKIAGQSVRVFEGIALKTSDELAQTKLEGAKGAVGASTHTAIVTDNHHDIQVSDIAHSATSAPSIDIRCFDCGKTIEKHEVYTLNTKPFCRECRLKIEAQKKKKDWICPQLKTLDERPFCDVIQSFLAKTEDCNPNCSLLQEDS